jgi:hypothetical protein
MLEETVRISFLKIAAANLLTWNRCGNSQHGNTAAVTMATTHASSTSGRRSFLQMREQPDDT